MSPPRRQQQTLTTPELEPDGRAEPDIGETVRRLRREHHMSLDELAARTGLSASFLSVVERGRSDVSLKRLTRIGHAFGLDVATLISYYAYRSTPQILGDGHWTPVDRGAGVDYRRLRLPGVEFELISATFQPRTTVSEALSHPGIDIVYVARGEVVLVYDGIDYPIAAGEAGVWSGAHPHAFRNDLDEVSQLVAVVTETVWERR